MASSAIRKDKNSSTYDRSGFSLIEVVLSSALLALFALAAIGSFYAAYETVTLSGQQSRAIFLAEEGLEAVRNMRDQSFANLSIGAYGLAIANNQWVFNGTVDTTGIFTRQIVLAAVTASTTQVTATVTWPQNLQRSGSVSLVTYLTQWK